MALAMATGRCWTQLLGQLPGFEPVAPANVLLLGARDLDPLEGSLLAESRVTVLRPADVNERLAAALDGLRRRVGDVYVHDDDGRVCRAALALLEALADAASSAGD